MRVRRIALPRNGFTLIELMVTIAIAAILMLIAAPSFVAFQRNSQLTAAANNLIAALASARGEATKRGMYAMVVPADGANWESGWVAFIDKNQDQAFEADADDTVFRQAALPSYFTVSPTGTANASPPYMMFDPSGYPVKKGNAFGALTFSIARNDLDPSSTLDQTRRVMISPSGRVRSCRPASATDATCSASNTTTTSN